MAAQNPITIRFNLKNTPNSNFVSNSESKYLLTYELQRSYHSDTDDFKNRSRHFSRLLCICQYPDIARYQQQLMYRARLSGLTSYFIFLPRFRRDECRVSLTRLCFHRVIATCQEKQRYMIQCIFVALAKYCVLVINT